MFGKKKKEEIKEVEEKTETLSMEGQGKGSKMPDPPLPPAPPRLGDVVWAEFAKDYGETVKLVDIVSLTQPERDGLIINLMLAIYGELRLIRDAANKGG